MPETDRFNTRPGPIATWFARMFPVEEGERLPVIVLFSHLFLVSAAVIGGKAARDAFFLSQYGKSILPLMYLLNAVAVALVMAAFSRVIKRFSAAVGSVATLGFFVVTLLLLELKLDGWMVGVLYVWMEVIGAVVILHAWLLTGNAFDPRQAKRLFGVVAAGGSLGAWGGGLCTAWVAGKFGSASLITLVAFALAVSIGTAWYASRFQAPRPRVRVIAPEQTGKRRRFSPYVTSIAILIAATAMVSAIVQYRFQVAAVAAYPGRDQLVAFFGHFYAWGGVSSLAVQLFLSGFLLSRFGLIAGLFVLPGFFSIASIWTLFSPSLVSAALGRFSDVTFKFTIHNSSVEMLWLPVPPEERQSTKPLIGGTLKAAAEASTALLMFFLVKATPPGVLSGLALAICAVWVITVLRLRGQYKLALAEVIEKRQLNAEALRLSAADPAVVDSIRRSLQSPDEAEQMAALTFLDGLPLDPWAPALRNLAEHGSPEIRARLFTLAARDPAVLPDEVVLASCRAGGELAPGAIEVALNRQLEGIGDLLTMLVNSPNARASVAAASAILRHQTGDIPHSRTVLNTWLASSDPATVVEVLRSLPTGSEVLSPDKLARLLRDSSFVVRCAALESLAATRNIDLLPEAVEALADARCFRAARLALREMPASNVVEHLVSRVSNGAPERLRQAALRLLRDYPEMVPEERLTSSVRPEELDCYTEFAELLQNVRRSRALQSGVTAQLREHSAVIRNEAYLCDAMLVYLQNDHDALLLRDFATRRYELAVTVTLRLTAVSHPDFPVDACLYAVHGRDRQTMPYVLELIETTVNSEEKRFLLPLVDVQQQERRSQIVHELVHDPEQQIRMRIQNGAASPDAWESEVVTDYLAQKGRRAKTAVANSTTTQDYTMYSKLEKTIILKSSDLFGALPAQNLSTLAEIATEMRSPVDAVLFREGESGDCLYIVASGRVRIVKGGSEIATIAKGACFGEMAVLDDAPRSADAVIMDEAVLLRIGSEEFYDVLAENPALTQGIVRLLTRRLREANAKIAHTQN